MILNKLKLGTNLLKKENKRKIIILLVITLLSGVPIISVSAFGPQNQTCYEAGTCGFFESPFNVMILPYQEVFGGFTFVFVWAIIIGIIWLRAGNTMYVGVVGLTLAAVFNMPLDLDGDGSPDFTAFGDDAQLIGFSLVAVAVAVVLFQILTVRTHFPSN